MSEAGFYRKPPQTAKDLSKMRQFSLRCYAMSDSTNFRLAERLSVTQVDDEVVLLKLDTGAYYGLNHIGSRFIEGVSNKESLAHIISAISERYQTPYQTVCNDLSELIEQLLEQQLIERVESA